jgi:hypothetical protein
MQDTLHLNLHLTKQDYKHECTTQANMASV